MDTPLSVIRTISEEEIKKSLYEFNFQSNELFNKLVAVEEKCKIQIEYLPVIFQYALVNKIGLEIEMPRVMLTRVITSAYSADEIRFNVFSLFANYYSLEYKKDPLFFPSKNRKKRKEVEVEILRRLNILKETSSTEAGLLSFSKAETGNLSII